MKKILLTFVALFCIISSTYAQHYEKSIEIYGGPGLNKFSKYSFGIEMINGVCFNNYFSLGIGIGFRSTKALYYNTYESHYVYGVLISKTYESFDTKYLIPVHARIKANLSSAKVSPFLMFDAGYTFDVGKNKNKNTEGLFYEPAFGIDINMNNGNSLYLVAGYNAQNAHYNHYSITDLTPSYSEEIKGNASTLDFKIGFVF